MAKDVLAAGWPMTPVEDTLLVLAVVLAGTDPAPDVALHPAATVAMVVLAIVAVLAVPLHMELAR